MAMLPPPGLEHVVPCGAFAPGNFELSEHIADELPTLLKLKSTLRHNDRPMDAYAALCDGDFNGRLAHGNAELMRKNAELRAHMDLMKENVALVQANALLAKQLEASRTTFGVKKPEGCTDRLPRKERRREFMRKQMEKEKVQSAANGLGAISSDVTRATRHAVLRRRFASSAESNDADATASGDSY